MPLKNKSKSSRFCKDSCWGSIIGSDSPDVFAIMMGEHGICWSLFIAMYQEQPYIPCKVKEVKCTMRVGNFLHCLNYACKLGICIKSGPCS